jgi:hypothetical protein
VEDILDDDFDSDTSGSQGECSYLTNPVQTAFLVGVEVDQYCECTNGDSAEELQNSKQTTESDLKEQFWRSVGFPKGARWWEEEASSIIATRPSFRPTLLVTNPGNATIFIWPSVKLAPVKSSPKTGTCLEKKSLDLGDVVHRGVWIRPWHGPLPQPKPAPVMVLGNFLPKQFVDQLSCADQQLMKETVSI